MLVRGCQLTKSGIHKTEPSSDLVPVVSQSAGCKMDSNSVPTITNVRYLLQTLDLRPLPLISPHFY